MNLWLGRFEHYPKNIPYSLQQQCLLKCLETGKHREIKFLCKLLYVDIVFYYEGSCNFPNCWSNKKVKKRKIYYFHDHIVNSASEHFEQCYFGCDNFSLPIEASQLNACERRIYCCKDNRFHYLPVTRRKLQF